MGVTLSTPWAEYSRKVTALFDNDPDIIDITMNSDDGKTYDLAIKVSGARKARAIAQILPRDVNFSGVKVITRVLCEEDKNPDIAQTFRDAFDGNSAVKKIATLNDPAGDPVTYISFAPQVVQFFDDNLGSLYGLKSTIYEDIAKEIFYDIDGVFYCTEEVE